MPPRSGASERLAPPAGRNCRAQPELLEARFLRGAYRLGPLIENRLPRPGPEAAVFSLAELPRGRITVSVLGTLLVIFLAALDQTIVATALPRVVADLGGLDLFAWIFTAYMLAATTSIPIMGKPESTEGGRRVSVLKRQEGAPVLLG